MAKLIFIAFIFLFPDHARAPVFYINDEIGYKIYLVQQRWHTGIVFDVRSIDLNIWSEISDFTQGRYVDVGWGDEEFYQYEGDFDPLLAVKALFYPTPSVLRIEGFSFDIDKYLKMSDMAVIIPSSKEQINKLSAYISDAYYKENNKIKLLSSKYSGNIRFYKAEGEYHAFRTCNTWIANGLEYAGFDIDASGVLLAADLFDRVKNLGTFIENDND